MEEPKTEFKTMTCPCGVVHEEEVFIMFDKVWDCPELCESCIAKEQVETEKQRREDNARKEWEDTVSPEYRRTSTDHADYPRQVHNACLRWLKGERVTGDERALFIGLIGESGRGKTRVVSQMVKQLIWRGDHVNWLNSSTFQWACQNQFNSGDKDECARILRMAMSRRWLILDDIGSLKSTEIVSDNLYAVLEHRTTKGLPMIWTSNETIDEMLTGLADKPRKRNISLLAGFSNMINI